MIEMNEQEIELVSGGVDLPGYPSAPGRPGDVLNPGNPWYPDVHVQI